MKKEYGISHAIVVAEKGLNTSDNIAFNIVAGNGYVFSQSLRGANRDFKDFVLDDSGYMTLIEGFRFKSGLVPRVINVTTNEGKKQKVEVDEKQVVIYNSKYAAKAKKDREAIIQKALELIENPSKYKRATSYRQLSM